MFVSTLNKGFRLTFANGWTISVQWGAANYCEGYLDNFHSLNQEQKQEMWKCKSAEIAICDKDQNWFQICEHDTVLGYQTPDQVATWIAKVAAFPLVE